MISRLLRANPCRVSDSTDMFPYDGILMLHKPRAGLTSS